MKFSSLIRITIALVILVLSLAVLGKQQAIAAEEDSEGITDALFPVEAGEKWGYADRTGKMVIKPQFDGAE